MNINDAFLPKQSKALLRAASLLEKGGWIQGHYRKDGAHCAYGAINDICNNDTKLEIAVTKKLQECVGGNIVGWNDSPTQTAENVIKTMRECARS